MKDFEDHDSVLDEDGNVNWTEVQVTLAKAFAAASKKAESVAPGADDLTAVAKLAFALIAVEEKARRQRYPGRQDL